jgi:anti-sigma regulatory factor (Ser/Thr protein kinase)
LCRRVVERLVPGGGADDDVAMVVVRSLPIAAQMRMQFPATPQVLSQIRQVLRRWLRAYEASPEETAALTLACGEACANAIEHAYSPSPRSFALDASYDAGLVTLTVRDSGRWRPARPSDRGRGLLMIEAVVDELDVLSTATGTEIVMRRRLGSA